MTLSKDEWVQRMEQQAEVERIEREVACRQTLEWVLAICRAKGIERLVWNHYWFVSAEDYRKLTGQLPQTSILLVPAEEAS